MVIVSFPNQSSGNRGHYNRARRVGDIRAGKAHDVCYVSDGQVLGNLHCCYCETGFGVSPDHCRTGIPFPNRFSSVGGDCHCRCNCVVTYGSGANATFSRLVFRAVFCANNQIVVVVWSGFRRLSCLWSFRVVGALLIWYSK